MMHCTIVYLSLVMLLMIIFMYNISYISSITKLRVNWRATATHHVGMDMLNNVATSVLERDDWR